jgi:hypothetical protein
VERQRIGSRWPSFRLPAPKVPATDSLATGRTAAGTEYEVRFGARESRLRRSGWAVELSLRTAGEDEWTFSSQRGPGRPPSVFHLTVSGQCPEPAELFALGWTPPRVAGVRFRTGNGRSIEARLLALPGHDGRLLFAPIDGTRLVTGIGVTELDGSTTEELFAPRPDPCEGAGRATFFTSYTFGS